MIVMLAFWGKIRDVIGKPFAEAVPELDGQPFFDILKDVFITGKAYEGKQEPAILSTKRGADYPLFRLHL